VGNLVWVILFWGGWHWGLKSGYHMRQSLHHLSPNSSPFSLVILEIGSCSLPRLAWAMILLSSYFKFSIIAGWHMHTTTPSLFSFEMRSCALFCPSFPGTTILLISPSQLQCDLLMPGVVDILEVGIQITWQRWGRWHLSGKVWEKMCSNFKAKGRFRFFVIVVR
jgi:hypothetical protein